MKTFIGFALLGVLLTGCDSAENGSSISLNINPTATFLRADAGDTPSAPVIVDLSAESISPGAEIRLRTTGSYYNSPALTTVNSAVGVFSSSTTLLGPDQLNRVVDAIDAGVDRVTQNTFTGNLVTDIPEDFRFKDEEVSVVVPTGAAYLFVGNHDTKQDDNTATAEGFRVEIEF